MHKLPDWLKKPVPFVVDSLPLFKESMSRIILDLGCGVGRNSIYLGKEGFTVVGLDTSRSALKKAKAWVRIDGMPNVAILRASMTHIPFKRKSFHGVISISVIHHAPKKGIQETIREIHRILKDDGLFVANLLSAKDYRFGSGEKLENGTFKVLEEFEEREFQEVHHFFSREEVSALLKAFTKLRIEPLRSGTERPHEYWKVIATK
ncbi:MAG: class I SAM-dependent methyltransferase [Candidatus Bathyarchaeota archaeon]|nr:MAG: class I SAM-dependent methyltransferase [Candidatus Bathyarchaeota archaeon]